VQVFLQSWQVIGTKTLLHFGKIGLEGRAKNAQHIPYALRITYEAHGAFDI
jgi:hypothetical protein